MNLGQKIKEIRKSRHMTQGELAIKAGLHQVSISDIERGKVVDPGFRQIMAISKALKILPEEFMNWKIAERIAAVPLIGKAIASPEGAYYTDQDFPPGGANEYIEIKDENAFALEVESDSMAPRIKPGDRIIITPNKKPVPNGLCVAKLKTGKVFLKRVEIINDMVLLKSDNLDYPTLHVNRENIDWIYRVDCIIPK
jgi:transcriptional regulator with XRE-family HTH domain